LFIDLVFVALFTVLGRNIEHCEGLSPSKLLWVWTNFSIAWGSRNLLLFYSTRFAANRDLTLFMRSAYGMGLYIMIMHTPDDLCIDDDFPPYLLNGYAIGLIFCRISMLFM